MAKPPSKKHPMKNTLAPVLAAVLAAGTLGTAALAQRPAPLSAQASSPHTMGWMQGPLPAADKTIRFTDRDFFTFPKLRWTVCHFRELMPSGKLAPAVIRVGGSLEARLIERGVRLPLGTSLGALYRKVG